MRASRVAGSVLPLNPNNRSKTARGSLSIGSGVVGVLQAIVLVRAQLTPSHAPKIADDSNPSSSDVSWVSLPNSFAASWSIVVPATTVASAPVNGTQVRNVPEDRACAPDRRTLLAEPPASPPKSSTWSLWAWSDRNVGGNSASGPSRSGDQNPIDMPFGT